MRLGDMQAKPHQRITKYPLLLKAVLKHTQDPHVQHTLRGMVRTVYYYIKSFQIQHKIFVPLIDVLSDSLFACSPVQLSSVKDFLESINDYLRVRDEALALSISAQRVEGYEVEGINEEVDKVKHVFVIILSLSVNLTAFLGLENLGEDICHSVLGALKAGEEKGVQILLMMLEHGCHIRADMQQALLFEDVQLTGL